MSMNVSAPRRRRHSKAYLAPRARGGERTFDLAPEIPFSTGRLFVPVGSEVGSIPINVLAIALALTAGLSHP